MITIIDYQMGNLRSVQKACESVGIAAKISSDPREIATSEKLVLPGVGAFGDAIAELRRRDLIEPIRDFAATGRPLRLALAGPRLLLAKNSAHGLESGPQDQRSADPARN